MDESMNSGPTYKKLPASEENGQEMWHFDLDAEKPTPYATCNRVNEFLYIGGYMAAENWDWLKEMGITCVVNVRKDPIENKSSKIEYVDIDVDDDEYEPIHWYFECTNTKIEQHRKGNGRILINCEQGISRSATICIMYMVGYGNYTLRNAYYELKRRRPVIHPNIYFWQFMTKCERQWRNRSSVSMYDNYGKKIPDVYLD